MRIALFTSQFPAKVSTFFARDVRALMEAGAEVDVFPIYPADPGLWRYVPDCLGEEVLPRNRVHHLGVAESVTPASLWRLLWRRPVRQDLLPLHASALRFGPGPTAKTAYAATRAAAWAARFPGGFDHALAYWGNYAATSAYLYSRLTGGTVPFSTFLHAGTDLYRDQVFLREKLLAARRIFVVCDYNRSFIQSLYPEDFPALEPKIYTHHLGLDFDDFPAGRAERAPDLIVAVGRLAKAKGFDHLIRAVALVRAEVPQVRLELVGDGPERASLQQLAESLGIMEAVHFAGWRAPSEAKQAIARATLLVHPSPFLGDAVPTVIKEAMALGTPVVGSNVAGIPELLDQGRCGELVEPGDPAAIARSVVRLLESPGLRAAYAGRARAFAEEVFDMWRNGERLVGLLREEGVVSSAGPPEQRSKPQPAGSLRGRGASIQRLL